MVIGPGGAQIWPDVIPDRPASRIPERESLTRPHTPLRSTPWRPRTRGWHGCDCPRNLEPCCSHVPRPTSSPPTVPCTDAINTICLLYTSDAADEEDSVDLGGRRIIKKKK